MNKFRLTDANNHSKAPGKYRGFFVADTPCPEHRIDLFLKGNYTRPVSSNPIPMRKIIYGINLTAGGCCDHTQISGSEETHVYFTDLLRQAGLLLYGRKTYDLMVPFWPEVARAQTGAPSMLEFAKVFDSLEKVVCSRTVDHFPGNPRVIRDNLAEEVMQLKQQPGKDISIGGVELPGELIRLGLVDEYYFLVHPVIAGQGRRLLDGIHPGAQEHLKLADARTLPSGCISLHYLHQ